MSDKNKSSTIKETAATYHPGQTAKVRTKTVKIVVEQHPDTFIAYPLSVDGAVVGQGDTAEEAFKSCVSALQAHIEAFGPEVLEVELPVIDAFLTETEVTY